MSLYLGKSLIGKVSTSFTNPDGGENTYDATLSSGNQMLEGVTAYSKGTKYTGQIPSKTSSNVTVSANTVTVPYGYYADEVKKTIASTTVAIPSITVSDTGLITASTNQGTGYVTGATKNATKQLTTKGATTVTPTSSEQTVVNAGTYVTGDIKVAATSGSSVENGTLATPTINTSTGVVTAGVSKSGYIASGTTSTLQLSTQGAKTITPSSSAQTAVSAGKYTTGNVTVSAVPTETKSITANGTYTPTSGKWFSSVTVNVPTESGESFETQTKTVNPSESQQVVRPDSGYDGLSSVTVNAMPSGVLSTPTIDSSGLVTATVGTSGYIASGTSKTLQLTTKGTATITPSETVQTIASGRYLTGTQTIVAIPSDYIGSAVVTQNYYIGDSEPSSSIGNDGDLYFVRG